MKKLLLAIAIGLITFAGYSQEEDDQVLIDSIEKSFTYQYGKVSLKDGIGEITIPKGFKYLEPEQARYVLVDLWGNPDDEDISMGLILPENQGVLSENGYVFNIQYDEIGYVKDDDADDIDYNELLAEMREESKEDNKLRAEAGYEPIEMIGWASAPFYDKERKILHWAKEVKFGEDPIHTLNYNVRILGRKGVLVLNAIASMPELPLVQKDIHNVLNIVEFSDGYKYSDFNPSVDEVAAWTIGGLVAGKVLAKVGFFALLIKFWKIIAIAVIGAFSFIIKKFKGKKDEEQDDNENQTLEPVQEVQS